MPILPSPISPARIICRYSCLNLLLLRRIRPRILTAPHEALGYGLEDEHERPPIAFGPQLRLDDQSEQPLATDRANPRRRPRHGPRVIVERGADTAHPRHANAIDV